MCVEFAFMSKFARLAVLAVVLGGPALAQQAAPPVMPAAPRASTPGLPPTPAAPAAAPKAAAPKQAAVTTEAPQHPRIARAVRDLEDAIKYMETAPHNFGGHKAKAIQDSKLAVAQLREALKYRAEQADKAAATPVAAKTAVPKAPSSGAAAAPAQPKAAPQLPSATAPAQPSQYPRTPLAPNMQQ